jgi:hypothetical protein
MNELIHVVNLFGVYLCISLHGVVAVKTLNQPRNSQILIS